MIKKNLYISAMMAFLFVGTPSFAGSPFGEKLKSMGEGLHYQVEGGVTVSNGEHSPLWLNANKYGLSSVKGDNGYMRASLIRPIETDSMQKWKIGYGVDLAGAYNFTSSFVVQQLFLDIQYKKVRLSIGSKERPMNLKNQELSTGSQTFGINSRPIPEVRIEIPEYLSLTGKSDWLGIKGHFGYGKATDSRWRKDYLPDGARYPDGALYHSKSGFLRIGNEKKFPLVFEAGLEMACQFGGIIRNYAGPGKDLHMGEGLSSFWHAIFPGGGDPGEGIYANAEGNTVGSLLFSLSYKFPTWKVRAYYDHFFEDHSMMFVEYGWKDGLAGLEVTLPKNPFVSSFVYEFIATKDQSGPIYHDHTENIPDQISATDNYYNHAMYGWSHWGQAIGNPLYSSPLYNSSGSLSFRNNRFKGHHFGISGNPFEGVHYRMLVSVTKNWGTYGSPYADPKRNGSFLFELTAAPKRIGNLNTKGWSLTGAFAFDKGSEIGNNTGFQFTLRKQGLFNL